jgi:hypothetical protein
MGSHGSDRMVHLPVQPAPISTNYVSSNPAHHAEVYSTQHYVIKFVSDLWQVYGFSVYSGFLHKYNEHVTLQLHVLKTKRTITFHLNWTHWTQKDNDMWRWKSRCWLARCTTKYVCGGGGINWLMGDHPHPLLITGSIHIKQTITKHCTCSFLLKKTTHYHKY